jgi:hypothetical protein
MSVQFPELSALLGHDAYKVHLVARVFYRGVAMDLQRMVRAAATQEWRSVRDLAYRIQVDCLQLSEYDAATAINELGRVPGERFADAYARHQPVIDRLLNRMDEFVH